MAARHTTTRRREDAAFTPLAATGLPHHAQLLRRRLQANDLETVLTASAAVRRELAAEGRHLVASSWRATRRGVTMELVFAAAGAAGAKARTKPL